MRQLRRIPHDFLRHASYIDASATQRAVLDHRRLRPVFRRTLGAGQPAAATTHGDQIVMPGHAPTPDRQCVPNAIIFAVFPPLRYSIMVFASVFGAALIVLTVYFIVVYNGFIFLRENVRRNWSNIDVLLVQRHDELPKLVEACKGYMRHERETLEGVMRARSAIDRARTSADLDALGDAETSLRSDLGRLFALAENYPELKASESFLKLQRRITELEESIADRRELYNDSVNTNNIRIDQFPQLIVARLFSFRKADLLEFSEAQTADVDIKALFA